MSARHSKQSQSPMPTMVAYGQQAYAVTIQPMPGNMGPVQVIPAHPQAQTVVVNTTPVAFPTTQHQGHPMNTRSSSKNHTSQPHVVPAPHHPRQRSNSTPSTPQNLNMHYPQYLQKPAKRADSPVQSGGSKGKGGKPIYFYDRNDPFYGFTNFSPHPVNYKGKRYPTSEHAFQAFKFMPHRPGIAEHIRTHSTNPRDAFNEARRFQPEVRVDWNQCKDQLMYDVLVEKFSQHPKLRQELLGTGGAELIEDSPVDWYWGCGADRKGKNQLGITLMRLRDYFRTKAGLTR